MSRNRRKENGEVGVELKYCEHCGGLWVRKRGEERVYCDRCQTKVAELPVPKKKAAKVTLPVRPRVLVDEYEVDESGDLQAAGGVA